MFHSLTVHPLRTNVLDLVGDNRLRDTRGRNIQVSRERMDRLFVVCVEGERVFEAQDNLTISAFLNRLPVGYWD